MSAEDKPLDFIRTMVAEDNRSGKYGGQVVTRFPPEPNGYLHIGHAKSIVLNFGLAMENGGRCNLRFDDTNPTKEEQEYVDAIQADVRWLGYEWSDLFFASDYFERLYAWAEVLIEKGLAYVDSLNEAEIREYRGTVTQPGKPSPYRDRSVEENLDLFRRMKAGEFPDGAHVLRAKIDLAAANMKLRDPPLYRIRHAHHHRTGDKWCIYPLYDYTHCLSDYIEGITHSICTLEFENNRALYDWILDELVTPPRPYQTEFARLNLNYTVMSKRKLLQLVKEGHVGGWDDPRMPTLAGMRRRGYTASGIRTFSERVGVAKANSVVDISLLEHTIREDLNHDAPRVMAVLRPLELLIENYPEGQVEDLEAAYWPEDVPKQEHRKVPFSRHLYIERDDFAEVAPKGWYRLAPGAEVRLRYGYLVTCTGVDKDAAGNVLRVRCTYDPATRGGSAPDGRKVKGTLHWVSVEHSITAEVRLYDRLFAHPNPDGDAEKSFLEHINPASLETLLDARVEPSLAATEGGRHFQFERQGYFFSDPVDSRPGALVFNRVVGLKDSWAKQSERAEAPAAPAPALKKPEPGPAKAKEPLTPEAEALVARGVGDEEARVVATSPELFAWLGAAGQVAPGAVAKWLVHELPKVAEGRALDALPFGAPALVQVVKLAEDGVVSTAGAREVLAELAKSGGDPAAIVKAKGLEQVSDTAALAATVDAVLAANPEEVARHKEGKKNLTGFFMGLIMKASGGKADPKAVTALLKQKLG
jgi:glutaminyl-tRNA synthetase